MVIKNVYLKTKIKKRIHFKIFTQNSYFIDRKKPKI
jgi:hypothetical protein